MNEVFAEMTGVALSRHLGRTLPEFLPEPIAKRLEEAVRHVIETESTVHDLELEGQRDDGGGDVDVAGDRLPGAADSGAGALGGRDRDRCERAQSGAKMRCAEQKSWQQRDVLPLQSRTKSTIRWRRSRTCFTCCAGSASWMRAH